MCLVELPNAQLSNGEAKIIELPMCLLTIVDLTIIDHLILVLCDFGKLRRFSIGLLVHHPVSDLNHCLPVALVQRMLILQLTRQRVAKDGRFVRT